MASAASKGSVDEASSSYGEWQPPSDDVALATHQHDHMHHLELGAGTNKAVLLTGDDDCKVFGQGFPLYFIFVRWVRGW